MIIKYLKTVLKKFKKNKKDRIHKRFSFISVKNKDY